MGLRGFERQGAAIPCLISSVIAAAGPDWADRRGTPKAHPLTFSLVRRHFGSNNAITPGGSSPFVSPSVHEDDEVGPDAARASPANEGEPGENKYPDAAWDHPPQIRTAEVVYLANEWKVEKYSITQLLIAKVPPLRTDIS